MTFSHTFDDGSWAVNTATGWHRCLDVLGQIINGVTVAWKDNINELREVYKARFHYS